MHPLGLATCRICRLLLRWWIDPLARSRGATTLGTHRAGKNPGASFWSGTGAPKRLCLRVRPFVFLAGAKLSLLHSGADRGSLRAESGIGWWPRHDRLAGRGTTSGEMGTTGVRMTSTRSPCGQRWHTQVTCHVTLSSCVNECELGISANCEPGRKRVSPVPLDFPAGMQPRGLA
jgi:hypothetical protein